LKRDFLHFIPVFFAVFHILPVSIGVVVDWNSIAEQILKGGQLSISGKTGLLSAEIYNTGLALLWLGYLVAMWHFIATSGIFRKKWKTGKVWIVFFAVMSSFFRLLTFVALLFNVMDYSYSQNPVFLMVSGAALLFMMVFVLYQPQILYGYIIVSGSAREEKEEAGNRSPGVRNNLSTAQQQTYSETLQGYMVEKQPFLDPDFQMKDLANAVDIPAHHCSYVINHLIGGNFRDWLNSYRIQYFVSNYPVLSDKMTVEAVARQSGFKSVSTFYNAFKKETGQMPKAYFASK
jgi:AraC-like DNA-binding protein